MSSQVRLLPALIGTAGVLLTLRFAALASNGEAQPPGEPAVETASTEPASKVERAEPAPPAAAMARTKGEAEVLQHLSARRAALDERERDLAMREQLIGVTEKRVEERLVELKGLEERLNVMLAKRDEAEEAQVVTLVKMYENMKPAEAARIFNRLDRQVLLTVASRMKPAKIGPVMAAMEPARAQDLTVMLALRLNVARKPAAEAPGVQARPTPPNG
jgi:flagellar motility protein MotE (MotC chaperone)